MYVCMYATAMPMKKCVQYFQSSVYDCSLASLSGVLSLHDLHSTSVPSLYPVHIQVLFFVFKLVAVLLKVTCHGQLSSGHSTNF